MFSCSVRLSLNDVALVLISACQVPLLLCLFYTKVSLYMQVFFFFFFFFFFFKMQLKIHNWLVFPLLGHKICIILFPRVSCSSSGARWKNRDQEKAPDHTHDQTTSTRRYKLFQSLNKILNQTHCFLWRWCWKWLMSETSHFFVISVESYSFRSTVQAAGKTRGVTQRLPTMSRNIFFFLDI